MWTKNKKTGFFELRQPDGWVITRTLPTVIETAIIDATTAATRRKVDSWSGAARAVKG